MTYLAGIVTSTHMIRWNNKHTRIGRMAKQAVLALFQLMRNERRDQVSASRSGCSGFRRLYCLIRLRSHYNLVADCALILRHSNMI